MTTRIEKRKVENGKSFGSDRTIAGLELVRCEFTASTLGQYDDPEMGLVVRDVVARRCVAARSWLAGVFADEVLVDGLTTKGRLRLEGCAFRHVTLRGRVGSWQIISPVAIHDEGMVRDLTDGVVRRYADVDWALDISEAEFDAADIWFVPGHLVRRDPATQFLVWRSKVADLDTSDLPIYAQIAISRFEVSPFESVVAVAPKRSKNFDRIRSELQELRDRGLAE